ncbi:hypothetical protein AMTR_s00011p00207260 [Amborella trichopoda]|uniref:Uncharacterized protein n=1 Tax=Amborella trichopoda TaxID=13333 RepID=W1NHJ3_AMBTC|nr:hypothetical protein AMTR_s00011p00207260 [Amborella trichopoda]
MRKETGETEIVVEGGEKAKVMDLSFKVRRVNNNWVMYPNPRKRLYESSSGEKPEWGTSAESSCRGEKMEAKICPESFAEIVAKPSELPMKIIVDLVRRYWPNPWFNKVIMSEDVHLRRLVLRIPKEGVESLMWITNRWERRAIKDGISIPMIIGDLASVVETQVRFETCEISHKLVIKEGWKGITKSFNLKAAVHKICFAIYHDDESKLRILARIRDNIL